MSENTAPTQLRPLAPVPQAMRELDPPKCRATGVKWHREHPDLGLIIGGRRYLWRVALAAINAGATLDQAEAIGRAERQRFTSETHARLTGSTCESAAAA